MKPASDGTTVTLFLCGDVMTGRGIDQILPHSVPPRLHEPYVRDARDYVRLAERANGPIERPVDFSYIWGDALGELERMAPDLRIINLETSITTSEEQAPSKSIHYRMHPENTPCLTAAGIDCCALANNHVLDWGRSGLAETMESLEGAGLRWAGAGLSLDEAAAPAAMEVGAGTRILVFSWGSVTSGIPPDWAANGERAGVNLLSGLSESTVEQIARQVDRHRREGDLVVVSLHWGGNWGYEIPHEQRRFARLLVDRAGVDLVHGHSSHHVKGIEVYRNRPILYGCGDFLTDYEGISGHEAYRDELGLMYFPRLDAGSGELVELLMTATRLEKLRVNRASAEDAEWLEGVLNREGKSLGTHVTPSPDATFALSW